MNAPKVKRNNHRISLSSHSAPALRSEYIVQCKSLTIKDFSWYWAWVRCCWVSCTHNLEDTLCMSATAEGLSADRLGGERALGIEKHGGCYHGDQKKFWVGLLSEMWWSVKCRGRWRMKSGFRSSKEAWPTPTQPFPWHRHKTQCPPPKGQDRPRGLLRNSSRFGNQIDLSSLRARWHFMPEGRRLDQLALFRTFMFIQVSVDLNLEWLQSIAGSWKVDVNTVKRF